jgi:ribonuclease HI
MINIWQDPWIPTSSTRKVISPRAGAVYTKVCDLISPITGQWDEELLNSLFCTVDRERIRHIPINNQGFHDFVAWSHTKHGQYTVRSGYHMQWKHQFGPNSSQLTAPNVSATNPVWKSVWSLQVPSKVKIFIWRSLHGIVPLKCVLANRHIGTSGECPICHQGPETVMHLLFLCPAAKSIWQNLELTDLIDEATNVDRSGSAVLEYLMRLQQNNMQGLEIVGLKEVIAVTCWYLWWIQRKRTRDESVPPIYKCKLSILSITAHAGKKPMNTGQVGSITWTRPEARTMKLNVDAAYYVEEGTGAVGAVIRDYEGRFVAAKMVLLPHVASAAMAEAAAMCQGLILAESIGCNRLVAESDSMETIEACSGGQRWWNESSAIFADCVDRVASIGEVSFKFCPREANQVAHELARHSFSSKSSCTWDDDPPRFLLDKLLNDVTKF